MNDRATASPPPARCAQYRLTLFVAGDEPNSRAAKANIAVLCEQDLKGRCVLEIVDVLENFEAASEKGILVTPTLYVSAPAPTTVIGNLNDRQRVRAALQLGDA